MPEPEEPSALELAEPSELTRLLERFPDIQPLGFRDGEYLIREDETSQDIFILVRGALVVERLGEGAAPVAMACLLAEPEQPVIVGEMAYLGAQRRAASVRSSGRSHALRLRPEHVDGILETFPGLTRVICRQFSRRLRETDQALSEFQARFALSPRRRVAAAGEVLFRTGEPADELVQLAAGSVLLERPGESRRVAPEDLPEGLLEPEAYLRGAAHAWTATVQDMTFLAVLGAEEREKVVRCFPGLALRVLAG